MDMTMDMSNELHMQGGRRTVRGCSNVRKSPCQTKTACVWLTNKGCRVDHTKSAASKSATPKSKTPKSKTPKSATPKSATPKSATPKSKTPSPKPKKASPMKAPTMKPRAKTV